MLRISARCARNFGSALAGLCLAAALPLAAQAQTALERIKQRGHLICGTSERRRLLAARCAGSVARLRHRSLPGAGGSHFQRPGEGEIHLAGLEGPADGAAERRDRRALAHHDLDTRPRRRLRPQLHRDQLFRRPGLPRPQDHRREGCQGAQRRLDLRGAGDDHRAQSRRLFPQSRHEIRGDRLCRPRRNDPGL